MVLLAAQVVGGGKGYGVSASWPGGQLPVGKAADARAGAKRAPIQAFRGQTKESQLQVAGRPRGKESSTQTHMCRARLIASEHARSHRSLAFAHVKEMHG